MALAPRPLLGSWGLSLALLLGACGSMRTVTRPLDVPTQLELRRMFEGRRVTVEFQPADPAPSAEGAALPPNRVVWGPTRFLADSVRVDAREGSVEVPLTRVRDLDANFVATGVVTGAGVGLLSGALVGAVLGFATGGGCGRPGAPFICFDRPTSALFVGFSLGIVGLPIGAIAGGISGVGPHWRLQ